MELAGVSATEYRLCEPAPGFAHLGYAVADDLFDTEAEGFELYRQAHAARLAWLAEQTELELAAFAAWETAHGFNRPVARARRRVILKGEDRD